MQPVASHARTSPGPASGSSPGYLTPNGVIFGKVYADCNGNHVQDNNEPGIPGVRVYLDNGTFAITDEAGKYSIYGVTARLHGLRMDNYTLPAGFKPEAIYSTNAGDGKSQFVDMIAAELHRADFAGDRVFGGVHEGAFGTGAGQGRSGFGSGGLVEKRPPAGSDRHVDGTAPRSCNRGHPRWRRCTQELRPGRHPGVRQQRRCPGTGDNSLAVRRRRRARHVRYCRFGWGDRQSGCCRRRQSGIRHRRWGSTSGPRCREKSG